MDIDTILINAAWTQACRSPLECWNQLSINSHTIWRQITTVDHTIILKGCPDDTVPRLMDLTPSPSGGCNWDTIWSIQLAGIPSHMHRTEWACTRCILVTRMMIKQQPATEPKGHTSQPDLINFVKDQLAVDFHTLQVKSWLG